MNLISQKTPELKSIYCTFLLVFLASINALFRTEPLQAQLSESAFSDQKFVIHSRILNEDRSCLIRLPENYDPSESKKYPVLVLLDGSAHFGIASRDVRSLSSEKLIPEMIIVAIENVDRERDFTITKLETVRENTMGGRRKFLDFMEQELIPYVDEHYRTKPFRILTGHSLGGLLAMNSYIDPNSLFNAYISLDPSIWWDEEIMNEKVALTSPASFEKKLYIATANMDNRNIERNKNRHDRLYSLLVEKAGDSANLKHETFNNENHRSVPGAAISEGLKFLFDSQKE